jgi:transglutaminase-like putative cysteine protease
VKSARGLHGGWTSAASAVLLLAIVLAVQRAPLPLPSTLLLAFLGLLLALFVREPNRMGLADWMLVGPYLLAVGVAFGRDLQEVSAPLQLFATIAAAVLAAAAPHARRGGIDQLSFVVAVLLYGATLLQRTEVPAQEVALFAGAAVVRIALARVRRLEQAQESGAASRASSLVLGPAVHRAVFAAALVLLSGPAASQGQRLRQHFEPEMRLLGRQLDALPERVNELVRRVRAAYEQWMGEWAPVPTQGGPPGWVESQLSGQQPLPAARQPGSAGGHVRVLEPDRLRFERDVRQPMDVPGVSNPAVLASVRSERPLEYAPYLRRSVFEAYEGGAWSLPAPGWEPWAGRAVIDVPGRLELWITAEPGGNGELFVPAPFLGTLTSMPLGRDRVGNIRVEGRYDGPVTIAAMTYLGPLELQVQPERRISGGLFQVPDAIRRHPDFRQALAAVRRRRARGENLVEAAAAYCRESFRYTRAPRHDEGADPILEFLRTRRGFCQHYASLCALLLRAEGVPARLGAGLAFGVERAGTWLYGADNGHAWVELWVDGMGWVPLDPTAGTFNLDTGRPSPGIGPAPPPGGAAAPGAAERRGDAGASEGQPSGQAAEPGPDARPLGAPEQPLRGAPEQAADSRPAAGPGAQDPVRRPQQGAEPSLSERLSGLRPGDLVRALAQKLDWLVLGLCAALSLAALATLRRRVRFEDALGDRPALAPDEAAAKLERLRVLLASARSPAEAVELLFQLFSCQMAAWGYGKLRHETEPDFALAVGRALGPDGQAAMESGVALVEEVRYGALEPSEPHATALERALEGVLHAVALSLGLRRPLAFRRPGIRPAAGRRTVT